MSLGPAAADDHRPPAAVLRRGSTFQRGLLGSYCWTSVDFPGATIGCGDSIWSFPRAADAKPGVAYLRFKKPVPPEQLSIRSWRNLDDGQPRGRGKKVDFRLEPRVSADGLMWQATWSLPESEGQYYLHAFGEWTDEEGTFFEQDASWTFHLRIR